MEATPALALEVGAAATAPEAVPGAGLDARHQNGARNDLDWTD
jgi:hypothetical protein